MLRRPNNDNRLRRRPAPALRAAVRAPACPHHHQGGLVGPQGRILRQAVAGGVESWRDGRGGRRRCQGQALESGRRIAQGRQKNAADTRAGRAGRIALAAARWRDSYSSSMEFATTPDISEAVSIIAFMALVAAR